MSDIHRFSPAFTIAEYYRYSARMFVITRSRPTDRARVVKIVMLFPISVILPCIEKLIDEELMTIHPDFILITIFSVLVMGAIVVAVKNTRVSSFSEQDEGVGQGFKPRLDN